MKNVERCRVELSTLANKILDTAIAESQRCSGAKEPRETPNECKEYDDKKACRYARSSAEPNGWECRPQCVREPNEPTRYGAGILCMIKPRKARRFGS